MIIVFYLYFYLYLFIYFIFITAMPNKSDVTASTCTPLQNQWASSVGEFPHYSSHAVNFFFLNFFLFMCLNM